MSQINALTLPCDSALLTARLSSVGCPNQSITGGWQSFRATYAPSPEASLSAIPSLSGITEALSWSPDGSFLLIWVEAEYGSDAWGPEILVETIPRAFPILKHARKRLAGDQHRSMSQARVDCTGLYGWTCEPSSCTPWPGNICLSTIWYTENGLALLRLSRLLMLSAVNFLLGIPVLAYTCLVAKAHTTSRRFHAKQGVMSDRAKPHYCDRMFSASLCFFLLSPHPSIR